MHNKTRMTKQIGRSMFPWCNWVIFFKIGNNLDKQYNMITSTYWIFLQRNYVIDFCNILWRGNTIMCIASDEKMCWEFLIDWKKNNNDYSDSVFTFYGWNTVSINFTITSLVSSVFDIHLSRLCTWNVNLLTDFKRGGHQFIGYVNVCPRITFNPMVDFKWIFF